MSAQMDDNVCRHFFCCEAVSVCFGKSAWVLQTQNFFPKGQPLMMALYIQQQRNGVFTIVSCLGVLAQSAADTEERFHALLPVGIRNFSATLRC